MKLGILISATVLLTSGCVSMDGRMVNANGGIHDCSTSGGGLGLGAIIGATAALVNNEICESNAEKNGYLLHEDIGYAGILLRTDLADEVVVKSSTAPAAPCVNSGDVIKNINNIDIFSLNEAMSGLFTKPGESINIVLLSNNTQKECEFQLTKK